jgi:hypothetical protein
MYTVRSKLKTLPTRPKILEYRAKKYTWLLKFK